MKATFTCLALLLISASLSSAQTDILRPTTETNSNSTAYGCTGQNTSSGSMPFAYDSAGQSTSSSLSVTGQIKAAYFAAHVFGGWVAAQKTYTGLSINSAGNANYVNSQGSIGQVGVVYSTDGGTTWLSLAHSSAGVGSLNGSVVLSASQDLTKLKVAICVESYAGGDSPAATEIGTLSDVWVNGTYNPSQPGGPSGGSGTGTGTRRGSIHIN